MIAVKTKGREGVFWKGEMTPTYIDCCAKNEVYLFLGNVWYCHR